MKSLIKFIAFALVVSVAIFAFASCGGKTEGGDTESVADNAPKGETQTWGNITIFVPEGMELKGGNILDENNPNVVNIHEKENEMHYFLVTLGDDEEDAASSIGTTKEFNEGAEDITFNFDGVEWKGVKYDFMGPVFQVYAAVNGHIVMVQCYGFECDSATTAAVLQSIKPAN